MAPWVRTVFIKYLPKLLVMRRPIYEGMNQYGWVIHFFTIWSEKFKIFFVSLLIHIFAQSFSQNCYIITFLKLIRDLRKIFSLIFLITFLSASHIPPIAAIYHSLLHLSLTFQCCITSIYASSWHGFEQHRPLHSASATVSSIIEFWSHDAGSSPYRS